MLVSGSTEAYKFGGKTIYPYAIRTMQRSVFNSLNSCLTTGVDSMWPKLPEKVERENHTKLLKKKNDEKEKILRELRTKNCAETLTDRVYNLYDKLLYKLTELKNNKNTPIRLIGFVTVLLVSTFITDVVLFETINIGGHALCAIPDIVLSKFFGKENDYLINLFKQHVHKRIVTDDEGNEKTVKSGFIMNYIKTKYIYPKVNEFLSELIPFKDMYEYILFDCCKFSKEQANDYANMDLYEKIRNRSIVNVSLWLMGSTINTINQDLVFNCITYTENLSHTASDLYNNSELTETFYSLYNSLTNIKEYPTAEESIAHVYKFLFLSNDEIVKDNLDKQKNEIDKRIEELNKNLQSKGLSSDIIKQYTQELDFLKKKKYDIDIEINKLKEQEEYKEQLEKEKKENIKRLSKMTKKEYDEYMKINKEKINKIKQDLLKLKINDPDLRQERYKYLKNLDNFFNNTPDSIDDFGKKLGFGSSSPPPSRPGNNTGTEPGSDSQSKSNTSDNSFISRINKNKIIRQEMIKDMEFSYNQNEKGSFDGTGISLDSFDNLTIKEMEEIKYLINACNTHEKIHDDISKLSNVDDITKMVDETFNENEKEEYHKLYKAVKDKNKKNNLNIKEIEKLIKSGITSKDVKQYIFKHKDDLKVYSNMVELRNMYFKLYGDALFKLQHNYKIDVTDKIRNLNELY